MSKAAVKFTDLDAFFITTEKMGFNGELKKLIYEGDRLPYCSAYLIPTELLPASFDFGAIDAFGGSIVKVNDIYYQGNEHFTTDFMIFPKSLSGYVEEEIDIYSNFTLDPNINDWTTGEMNYVINLEDGGGQEFYFSANGALISLSSTSDEEPLMFKTHKQVNRQLESLREKYPSTCRIYAVENRDFEERKKALSKPSKS